MANLAASHSVLQLFLLLEIALFGMTYVFGGRGVQSLAYLRRENRHLRQGIEKLQHDISALEEQLKNWRTDDFYREQWAREQLLLARPQEQIYYLV